MALDKQQAIACFLRHFREPAGLPLVTEADMANLFGEGVMEALAELKAYDALHHVCAECDDKCCRLVSCEFYEPNFPACTIHDFRPVICRLHFCHRFGSENKELIKALGDMFMSGLESAEKIDAIARFYDSPPLSPHAHKLVQQILPLFDAFREGEMDAASIIKISEKAAEQYRKGKP